MSARYFKKGRRVLCKGARIKYVFVRAHTKMHSVRAMCHALKLHPSGYYAWLKNPVSKREQEDQRLLVLIKEHYLASGGTYGSPWIHKDLRETGEACSVHRVAKIMRKYRIKAKIGYKRRYIKGGKTAKVAANLLNRRLHKVVPCLLICT